MSSGINSARKSRVPEDRNEEPHIELILLCRRPQPNWSAISTAGKLHFQHVYGRRRDVSYPDGLQFIITYYRTGRTR